MPRRLLLFLLFLASPLSPQRPGPPPLASTAGVRTTSLAVRVEVVDGVATTRLVQRIRNDSTTPQAEAIWVLPLPAGAAADDFRMTVEGVEMTGEVLGADLARGVYENIVRSRRDPGLLEYVGRGCLRARVFPIPAGKEIGVEVTFRHVLPNEGGLSRWSFPVRAAGVDGRAPDAVTLDLSVRSRRQIKNAFSPLAAVEVVQADDFSVRASFEGKGAELPAEELEVFYGLSEKDFGLNLLSYRGEEASEGTFLMLLSPKRDWGDEVVVKKEIVFVLDTSGSMAGEKIQQARESLRFFLSSLRREDRFNVVPFSTEPRPFFAGPVEASEENVAAAMRQVAGVEAVGGTNIAAALRVALQATPGSSDHVSMVVFLTDGLPTVGTTAPEEILKSVRSQNLSSARIFVLGVGNDVNTVLLDTLAEETRGTRDYVRPAESIELKSGALFTKLSNPVLTDLSLSVDGLRISRVVPGELADLFEGERLEVFGRYEGAGPRAIRLSGTFRGARREYVFEGTFAEPSASDLDFLPALWAQRRVGVLLDEVRRNGEHAELVDEIVRLGRNFDIVTPYTSHLIVEDGMEVAAGQPVRRREGADFRGPGDTVPPGGGPASPGSPVGSSAGAESGSDGFFLGRGAGLTLDRDALVLRIVEGLKAGEILAADADDQAYHAFAGQIVLHLGKAEDELRVLHSKAVVGEEAVLRSQYLRELVQDGKQGDGQALRELFTRRVKGKVFRLRRGVWTEEELEAEGTLERRAVEAYSADYFGLLREHPELRPYFAIGERVRVRVGDLVVEVLPPAALEPAPLESAPEQPAQR